jgi:hypothetical protein
MMCNQHIMLVAPAAGRQRDTSLIIHKAVPTQLLKMSAASSTQHLCTSHVTIAFYSHAMSSAILVSLVIRLSLGTSLQLCSSRPIAVLVPQVQAQQTLVESNRH